MIKEYIEKMLDKYFAKKAMNMLRSRLAIIGHQSKIVEQKDRYEYYAGGFNTDEKDLKWLIDIKFEDGLEKYVMLYMHDLQDVKEALQDILKETKNEEN